MSHLFPLTVVVQEEPEDCIRPVQLPPFDPVENWCPLWRTARIILKGKLPTQIAFRCAPNDSSKVEIDDDWAICMIRLCPPEDKEALFDRLATIDFLIRHAENAENYRPFLGQMMTASTISTCNAVLTQNECKREERGWPTLIQIVAHVLGIKPSPYEPMRSIFFKLEVNI